MSYPKNNAIFPIIGSLVAQWGIDNGYSDITVSDFLSVFTTGETTTSKMSRGSKKSAKKSSRNKKTSKKTTTKRGVEKTTTKRGVKKSATKSGPRSRRTANGAGNVDAVVAYLKKNGSAKAADLEGIVPTDPNARAKFLGNLIDQNLIRREGKARATTYFSA